MNREIKFRVWDRALNKMITKAISAITGNAIAVAIKNVLNPKSILFTHLHLGYFLHFIH